MKMNLQSSSLFPLSVKTGYECSVYKKSICSKMVSDSITWSLYLSHCREEINFVSCSVVLLVSFPFSCCPYPCHLQFVNKSQLFWASEENKLWWDLLTRKHYSLYGLVSEAISSDPIIFDLGGLHCYLQSCWNMVVYFVISPISLVLAVLNQTTMLYHCCYLFNGILWCLQFWTKPLCYTFVTLLLSF